MEITQEHIDRIGHLFPKPRRKAGIDNLTFLQALQYMAENGCRLSVACRRVLLSMILKDRAYEGDACRARTEKCGMRPGGASEE